MKVYRVYENVQGGCADDECTQVFCAQETRSYHNNRKGALKAIADMIKLEAWDLKKRGIISDHNLYNLLSNWTSMRVGESRSRMRSFYKYEIEEIDVKESVDNGMPIYYDQYGLYEGD